MFLYKCINAIRVVSELKNGFPVYAVINEGLKSASKNFYFIKDAIDNNLLESLNDQECSFISTKERKTYGKDKNQVKIPENDLEESLLKIAKILQFEPVLISIKNEIKSLQNFDAIKANTKDLEEFLSSFSYNLHLVSSAPIQLKMAEKCEFFVFRMEFLQTEHYVIKIGSPEKDESPLIRIHSACYTGDLLASLRCDCGDQLKEGIKFINENKNFNGGYFLYLMQEGRGIGLANKIKAYDMQQNSGLDTVDSNLTLGFKDDERDFTIAAQMLKFFGVKSVCLLTNNPKKFNALESLGIQVIKTVNTIFAENSHNKDYLEVKERRMGHVFNQESSPLEKMQD